MSKKINQKGKVHPSIFFSTVDCRTGYDIFEQYDGELQEKLKNVHPLNFISTAITLPVFELVVEFDTKSGIRKRISKYLVSENIEFYDYWAEMFLDDCLADKPVSNVEIIDVRRVCDAVLRIG